MTFRATATDAAGNESGCSGPISYTEDSTSSTPIITGTDPASPANANQLKLKGSGAEAGGSASVYDGPTCTGAQLLDRPAAEFNGAGIDLTVADDTTTVYRVLAYDPVGNPSDCSNPVSFTEDSTAVLPTPTLDMVDPRSPANDLSPRFRGVAEIDSTIRVYDTPGCTGTALFVRPAVDLGQSGLEIQVATNETHEYRITATGTPLRAENVSGCSNGISYTHDSIAPAAPLLSGTTPPSGANDNKPKVQGTAEAGSSCPDLRHGRLRRPADRDRDRGRVRERRGRRSRCPTTPRRRWGLARHPDAAQNVSTCSAAITYAEVTPIVSPGPGLEPPEDEACSAARSKLAKAKEKLKKAKESGKKGKIKKAKEKVKKAKKTVAEACG